VIAPLGAEDVALEPRERLLELRLAANRIER
jgi:hypothetical protein